MTERQAPTLRSKASPLGQYLTMRGIVPAAHQSSRYQRSTAQAWPVIGCFVVIRFLSTQAESAPNLRATCMAEEPEQYS